MSKIVAADAQERLNILERVKAWQIEAPDPHLVSLLEPSSFAADQFRVLRHQIEEQRRLGVKVVAITSAAPRDGKSLITLNLAIALAQTSDARIAVVDADLRLPSVLRTLGTGTGPVRPPGVSDLVRDPKAQLVGALRWYEGARLYVLPAGRQTSAPYEVLKSARFESLLAQCRELFDFVLVDTPPAVPFPDFRLVERWVDATLLVVSARYTSAAAVDELTRMVDPNKVLGVVFNRAKIDAERYGRYYK